MRGGRPTATSGIRGSLHAPGRAGADHDGGRTRVHDDRPSATGAVPTQASSTRTDVGFVIASYTAERFCDWAMIASRSARGASASISYVTAMSWNPFRT